MSLHAYPEAVGRQEWLEPIADAIQKPVNSAMEAAGPAGRSVDDFLNGVWLGHPLHPPITDIPLGAWTVSTICDAIEAATGKDDLAPGADAAVMVGLAGALGSAVTGLAQWRHLDDSRQKRVGVAHALMNVTVTALMTTSLVLRRQGNRPAARTAAFLGYAIGGASAYLGGYLAFDQKVGADHAPRREDLPDGWFAVMPDEKLREGQMKAVKAGNVDVVVARRNGTIRALANSCSHLGGPLAEGTLEGDCVVCPWHGSRFRLSDGSVANGPSSYAQPRFDVRVLDGWIEVRAVKEQTAVEGTRSELVEKS